MNLFGLSPGELILIALVAMIVLGPEKLPETAASVGRWIREFRRVTQELTEQFADESLYGNPAGTVMTNEPVAVAAVPERLHWRRATPSITSVTRAPTSKPLVFPRRQTVWSRGLRGGATILITPPTIRQSTTPGITVALTATTSMTRK